MIQNFIKKYKNMNPQVKMAFWFLVCNFLQKAIGVIFTPVFTRIMTASEFGRYSVYNSWSNIIVVFATLSISGNCYTRGLVVTDGEEERQRFTSTLFSLVTLCVAICVIFYCVFFNIINSTTGLNEYLFVIMFVDMLLTTAYQFWINEKRVKCSYRQIVILTMLYTILRPLCATIAVMSVEECYQVEARLTAMVLVDFVLFSWIIVRIFKRGRSVFDRSNWGYALSFCIPLIPHYLSKIILNESDRIMISHYCGTTETAYYTIAYTIAGVMVLFNGAIAQSLDPWIYNSIKERKIEKIGPISNRLVVLIAILNFCVVTIAPEALRILAPKNYFEALSVIPPVTASVFFMFMYDLFASFQFFFKKTRWIAFASCGGAALNIILNAIFIPKFGLVAAGYTTLCCYIIFGVLHYYFMRKICSTYLDDYIVYDWKIIFGIGFCLVVSSIGMSFLYKYWIIRYGILFAVSLALIINRKTIRSIITEIR